MESGYTLTITNGHLNIYSVYYGEDRMIFTRFCWCRDDNSCPCDVCPCHSALLRLTFDIERLASVGKVMTLDIRSYPQHYVPNCMCDLDAYFCWCGDGMYPPCSCHDKKEAQNGSH